MEVKQCAAVEPRKGMSKKGGECLALPTFSRHGKVQVNLTLLIWLNENVPSYLRTWTQTAKWSTRKRRSYVSSSSGVTDKPKGECKEKKRMSGRSQAPEGNGRSSERHLCLHKDVRVVTDEGKANEAMAECNGNPVKQWNEDRHSQSLIASVHSVQG